MTAPAAGSDTAAAPSCRANKRRKLPNIGLGPINAGPSTPSRHRGRWTPNVGLRCWVNRPQKTRCSFELSVAAWRALSPRYRRHYRRRIARNSRAARRLTQGGADAGDHAGPRPAIVLAKQAGGRIPGAVLAIQEPAPLRYERQHDPDRLRQRAREVGDAGIDGDDEVQIGDQRRGF